MSKKCPALLAYPGQASVEVIQRLVREAQIESAVVYQDRAEVKRRFELCLATGINELIITDLSESVDSNSIRVEGQGNAVITDVIYSSTKSSSEQPPVPGSKEQHQRLLGEISELKKEIRHLAIERDVLEEEKKLLKKFSKHVSSVHTVKGSEHSLNGLFDGESVSRVLTIFQRIEDKVSNLDQRLNKLSDRECSLNEELGVLNTKADSLNPNKRNTSKQTLRSLHVGLETEAAGEAVLFMSYIVSDASWSSSYDVRVFSKDNTMKVQYYGIIEQSSGEDWENARLSLSTAQPSVGGSAPSLPTKIVRFIRTYVPMYNSLKQGQARGASYSSVAYDASSSSDEGEFYGMPAPPGMPMAAGGPPPPEPVTVDVAEVTAGLFNTTYTILRATSIPADSTEHKVTIAMIDLEPELTYSSVPSLSPYSFLQARATNSSPYTLLAGPSNVFLDSNFIAKSVLPDVSPNEEFEISLGADQSIRITTRPTSSVQSTRGGKLGGSKTTSITYTSSFDVKNTRDSPVSIKLLEPVPLTTDERIKVIINEPSIKKASDKVSLPYGTASLTDDNHLEWCVKDLEPSSELTLKLVYTVEHPASDGVAGLPK